MIFDLGLTHLDSEASIYFASLIKLKYDEFCCNFDQNQNYEKNVTSHEITHKVTKYIHMTFYK